MLHTRVLGSSIRRLIPRPALWEWWLGVVVDACACISGAPRGRERVWALVGKRASV